MNGDYSGSGQVSFPVSYDEIIGRIQRIDPVRYAFSRNYTNGAVTYLSPYISRGVISVKMVRDVTLARGFRPESIEKFLQELAWREYFQRVWQAKGDLIFQDLKQTQPDVRHYQMIDSLVAASTGIRAIDRAIDDFYATGYIHNHVRMYIASIACNIGRAHWLIPSRWMYAHLLDGDLASNACSWQWVAGAFSSKKYYCDQHNINRYTGDDQQHSFLDADGDTLRQMPVPAALSSTSPWKLQTRLPVFPKPVLDPTLPTLIYNSYNLDPTWRSSEAANRVLLLEPSHFARFPVSERVLEFIISLGTNIPGLLIFTGEVGELASLYGESDVNHKLISKEHPAFGHYPGVRDERDWMFPELRGYYPSFFAFWKKAGRVLTDTSQGGA